MINELQRHRYSTGVEFSWNPKPIYILLFDGFFHHIDLYLNLFCGTQSIKYGTNSIS